MLLKVFIPSWRFFDCVGPVPCLQIQEFGTQQTLWQNWPEAPIEESLEQRFKRLFYNPRGNERLYVFSCVERLLNEIAESDQEPSHAKDWSSSPHYRALSERLFQNFPQGFRFRIQVTHPDGKEEIVFLSADHGPRERST